MDTAKIMVGHRLFACLGNMYFFCSLLLQMNHFIIFRKVIEESYSLLIPPWANNEHVQVISADKFNSQVRQVIRWHCRLNHVAAHTKLLTGLFLFCQIYILISSCLICILFIIYCILLYSFLR